jgi:hypothetical protein
MADIPGIDKIHEQLTWDDVKVPGILIFICFAFGLVIIYMYKEMKANLKEHAGEIKELHSVYSDKLKDQEKEYDLKESRLLNLIATFGDKYNETVRMLTDVFSKKR